MNNSIFSRSDVSVNFLGHERSKYENVSYAQEFARLKKITVIEHRVMAINNHETHERKC